MENGGSKWQDGVSPWERRQKLRYEKQLQSAGIAAAGSRLLVVFYWTLKTEFCFILSGGNVCMFWGIRKSITCVYFYFYVYGEMSTYTCKLPLLETPNQVCSINCIGPEADSDTEPTSEPEVQEEAAKTSVSGNPIGNLQEKNMGDAKATASGSKDALQTDPATLPKTTQKQDRQARNEVAAQLGVSRRQFEAILGEPPRPRGGKRNTQKTQKASAKKKS